MPRRPVRTVILAALGLGLVSGLACRISNEDHCVHKALDADAWCADNVKDRPFCSPCEAADHGCVADQPDEEDCPAYTPDGESTDSDTDSDTTA